MATLQTHGRTHPTTQDPRLSELLGEHDWRSTGLGASIDINELQQHIVTLEQQIVELRRNSKNATQTSPPTANSMAQLNVSKATD
ncbi:hypothetical protein [Mycobacterium lepromatosis]|uniref:hypothetical protein n=1 Tax=Mycobacterium lepromatosis TaxID=480418 RepID=UPI000AB67FA3|nr:hypothetical protein [Mycobacterium lepromatosis]